MARDEKLWKRNALAIPGGLLVLYALAGLLYVLAYRTPTPACAVAHRFLVGGHCYSAYPFLGALLLLGVALVVVGLVVFRGKPGELPGHLHSGTPTHFALAFLASLVLVPAVVWLILYYVEASQDLAPFLTTIGETKYQTKGLFILVAGGGTLALAPFLGLYLAHGRLRRTFLREVEEVAAQEEPFPGESAAKEGEALAVPPEEFMDDSVWPDSRAEEASPAAPGDDAQPSPEPQAPPASTPAKPPASTPAKPPAATPAKPPASTPAKPPASTPPAPWSPPAKEVPAYLTPPPARKPSEAQAPVVPVATGCQAVLGTGQACGKGVGPGGKYCLTHACQALTASGTPCRNPATVGGTKCPAHG